MDLQANPPVDRRTLLRGLAVGGGVVAAAAVAGCGSQDPEAAESAGGGGGGASGGGTDGGGTDGGGGASAVLAPTSEVPIGSATIFTAEQVVVSQPRRGEFVAFSAVCTHQGCIVGRIERDEIVCPCHGSRYAVADGSVVNGPATESLAEQPVRVQGRNLVLG